MKISPTFWITGGKFAFQYVDGAFRVYDKMGNFIREFEQFGDMVDYMVRRK